MARQPKRDSQPRLLPWSPEPGERLRLGLALALMMAIFLPAALMIPRIQLPEPERTEAERVPPQLARLLERPVVLQPEPEPEPTPEPEAEPQPERVSKPEPKPEPRPAPEVEVAREPAPVPKATPEAKSESSPKPQTVEQARSVAARSGLMAMQDQLAAMRAPAEARVETLAANIGPTPEAQRRTDQEARQRALAGSGGVSETGAPEGKVALARHQVKEVVAPAEPVVAKAARPAAPTPAQRGMNNIRKVFASNKTALYAIYNRELRVDPTLEGKVLLELVIEPDGSVSRCQVVSSELANPALEARIANRVRLFNFGAGDVEARTVRYPIDFLPS